MKFVDTAILFVALINAAGAAPVQKREVNVGSKGLGLFLPTYIA